jgi:hypothetical protein
MALHFINAKEQNAKDPAIEASIEQMLRKVRPDWVRPEDGKSTYECQWRAKAIAARLSQTDRADERQKILHRELLKIAA